MPFEFCEICDSKTGRAGKSDDSLYSIWKIKPPDLSKEVDDSVGPLCEECYNCLSICGFIA